MIFSVYGIHDPSTAFNDIKPLPEFSPFGLGLLAVFALLTLLILSLLYWVLFKRRKRPTPLLVVKKPHEVALEELLSLRQQRNTGELDIRQLAAALSLTFRGYLEAVFKFSATEATSKEIISVLPQRIAKMLPMLKQERLSEVVQESSSILNFIQYLCFADDSQQKYFLEGREVEDVLTKTERLIRSLNQDFESEEERRSSSANSKAHDVQGDAGYAV